MLSKELLNLFDKREFIGVATCDFKGHPTAAPKFILKVESGRIYLVDYTVSKTWENLKTNPRISMSLIDPMTLKGYQVNGNVKILSKGKLYKKLCEEMTDKEVRLTAQHIIDEVRGNPAHETFEILMSERFVIFEVTVGEVVELDIQGKIKRSKK